MKILKKIVIVIVVIVLIPLIAALFLNKDFSVEREIVINKPTQVVFDYIKYLKNQDNFSIWAKIDPNMKKTFSGVDGSVGFISAWDSDNEDVGKGEQEILKINPNKRIDFELRFIKPFEATNEAYMITEAYGKNKTKVIWGFAGRMDYPMNLMLVFMDFEGMLGKDLSTGLENLKLILDNK